MQIPDLPDFPAVQQIKDALWHNGDVRGAAVMVGAGFSRLAKLNAVSTSLPPLWHDFSDRMAKHLYPNDKAPSDPLRLAQEYKAALGDSALDGLIRSLIQDDKWEPSELHETLLSLPWADTLTTNWDTLLERTSLLETERSYEVVRTPDDIARTRAPRIVKLHGSFPANKPFIFTEEDYRTYPKKFAPFVNLAQQVLLENELCLLGFSGDDPNFLQWTGWVRDNLGEASRQIRLVGVLNLSPSRREMLKQQNVTPIDLAPLVENIPNDVKHSKAISMFLEWLHSSKPLESHVWERPSQDLLPKPSTTDSEAPTLKDLAKAWEQDRLKHPGWLVTPGTTQEHFRYETDSHYPRLNQLVEASDLKAKMRLLFELAFRHDIAFWPLGKQFLEVTEKTYSKGGDKHLSQQEKTQLCASLYSEARRRWDWNSFDFWASQLESFDDTDAHAHLLYGKALRAKQEFDYVTLEELIPQILGNDPIWKMRQGMLYTFLYDDEKAARCFQEALTNIRARRVKDKQSIWLLSREAWAAWIYHSAWRELPENKDKPYKHLDAWPSHYGQKECDPWDYLSFVDRETAEAFEKKLNKNIAKTPLFNAGHYQDNSQTQYFINHATVLTFDLYIRLQETVGIPSRIGHTDLLSSRLSHAFEAKVCNSESDFFNAVNFITDADKGLIDIVFNRVEVAKLPLQIVIRLASCIKEITDYFLKKGKESRYHINLVNRATKNIELISRLSVRMPADEAHKYYQWALELCKDDTIRHWWIYKYIENLLKRSLEALPKSDRANLAETAIFLPLPGERNTGGNEPDWPELIGQFEQHNFSKPEKHLEWSKRIAKLIEAIETGTELDRSRAILRMHTLYKANLLETNEEKDLAKAIWEKRNKINEWPSAQNLYPFIFLELPEIKKGQAEELFQLLLIKPAIDGIISENIIKAINGGLKSSKTTMENSRKNLGGIIKTCMEWKPQAEGNNYFLNNINSQNIQCENAIANTLAYTLLPEINSESICKGIKEIWYTHLNNPERHYFAITAFEFSRLYPDMRNETVRIIRKAIHSKISHKISSGYLAIQQFIKAANIDKKQVPEILINDVLSACESMKELSLHHALQTAIKLVEAEIIDDDKKLRLAETVELLWSEYSYDTQVSNEERIIILTLVRSETAKLAKTLLDKNVENDDIKVIYEEAQKDPIPEVRYAV